MNLFESVKKNLKEGVDTIGATDAGAFKTAFVDRMRADGYHVYTKGNNEFDVSKGDLTIYVGIYDAQESPYAIFEDVANIGIGGDPGIMPVYPNNSWEYETATPKQYQPNIGEPVYAIFQALDKTSIDEVSKVIADSFDKAESTNSSNKPDGETMKEEMLRAFKMAYPEETISSKQFVESKQYMDVYCESGYAYRLEYNDGNVVTTCLNA